MPALTEEELQRRQAALVAKIKNVLPDFVKACLASDDAVIVHQDSFAADYQEDEYALLGMAIKFAGLHGKEIRIIGANRETLTGTRKSELVQ